MIMLGLCGLMLPTFRPRRRARHAQRRAREPKTSPAVSPSSLATAFPIATPARAELVGKCYVIDGDTIVIDGTSIRIAGLDAPEMDQPWGKKAKWELHALCKGQRIRAEFDGTMSYERDVATCYLPDGRDLSAEMVKRGLALDWRKYSGGKYRHLEPAGVRKSLWRVDARQKGRMPPAN
jgi:micrococcal nuclease